MEVEDMPPAVPAWAVSKSVAVPVPGEPVFKTFEVKAKNAELTDNYVKGAASVLGNR